MKKRILSFLLVAVMLIGVIPFSAMAAGTEATPTVADTTWYTANENADTYYLYDAADLLGFAKLGSEGKTFAGKTVVLMADIDLNPGWSADVTEDGTVVFPEAPANVWANIPTFNGVFNGNGYTVSGLYKSMTVLGDKGAYGGLFNVLGGTVKDVRISNSFITASNTTWGSGNIHFGGVAGEVNAGALISSVYMDETVEIWYRADGHCNLGGAYAFANGAATVTGFIFVGVIGNTSLANAVNYACPSDKKIVIATVVANTGYKGCTTTNCLGLKTSIHSGKTYNSNNDRMGLWDEQSTANCIANTRESAAWLLTRPTDYGANFTWSDALGAICPNISLELVNGTYAHAKADKAVSSFETEATDANTYAVYTAEELLAVLNNGGNFAGKTIMLMADINLNPGWSADVTEDGTVVFPEAPATVWPEIASFAGTFDGNGYTLSGLYKSMTVSGSTGAYGGLFNTLAGGTVKNLRISNSFVLATNTGAGSGNIHVGGIAGDVAANSLLSNVYMDDTVEVWYKCDQQACIGGAFGYSTGAFNATGFVFVGVVGNTNLAQAVEYKYSGSGKLYMAGLLAATGGNKSTLLNSTCLATSLHTGGTNNTWGAVVGTWQDGMTVKSCATTPESEAWLPTRPNDYAITHYWNAELGSIMPKECKDILEGTYEHIVITTPPELTPVIMYQTTEVVDGTYSIRFLAGINDLDVYNKVGFEITLIVGGNTYVLPVDETTTTTVFTSIIADGKTVEAKDAGDGYNYLYVCVIEDVTASDDIVINVSAVNVDSNDNVFTGSVVTFGFNNGNGNVIAK